MKVKARKLLSLLLTIAMVAGMLVLPASAAFDKDKYELCLINATTADTDGFFTLDSGGGTKSISLTCPASSHDPAKSGSSIVTYASKGSITFTPTKAGTVTFWARVNSDTNVGASKMVKQGSTEVTVAIDGGATDIGKTLTKCTFTAEANKEYKIAKNGTEFQVAHIIWEALVPSITLPESAVVAPNGSTPLTATVKNADDATIEWTSSNTSVATVDSSGKVTAVAESGTTTITAKITVDGKDYSDICEVTVTSHVHNWAEDTTDSEYKAATCTEDGLKVEKCTAESTCPDSSRKTTVIEKLGHNDADHAKAVADVAATCTTTGLTGKKICGRANGTETCQEVVVPGTVANRLGHDFNAEGACTRQGCSAKASATMEFDFQCAEADFTGDLGYFPELKGFNNTTDDKYVATIDNTTYGPSRLKLDGSGKLTFKAPGEGTLTVYFCATPDGMKTASSYKLNDKVETLTVAANDSKGAKVEVSTGLNQTYTFVRATNKSDATYGIYKLAWKSNNAQQPKDMTVTAENVSTVYDGQAHGITVKVTDPATGATVKYGAAEGTYDLDASPTITNVSDSPKTVYYQVTADGYNTVTGSKTITITQAEPTVDLSAIRTSLQGDDTVRTFKLTVTAPAYVAASDITVTGVVDGTSDTVTTTKNNDDKYQVLLPDETKDYTFTAKVAATTNYKAAASHEVKVAVTKQGEVKKTYVIECDTAVITFPEGNTSTLDKVEYRSTVTATAKPAPEGKVFDKWEVTGLTLTADELKKNPLVFQMPGKKVTLKATYKDETAEPVEVKKDALTAAIASAKDAKDMVVVNTAAANVDKGALWVLETDMTTFETAIASAEAVAAKENAIQAEVDAAAAALNGAINAFTDTVKDGEKVASDEEKYSLTAAEVYNYLKGQGKTEEGEKITLENDTPIENQGTNGIFTVYPKKNGTTGSIDKNSRKWDDLTDAEETKRFNFGGNSMTMENNEANVACVIKFTIDEPANVKVWWGTKTANAVALYVADAAAPKYISEKVAVDTNASYTSTIAATEAGTYYLGGTDNGAKGNFYPVKVQVTVGGSDEVNKDALETAIKAAETAIAGVKVSVDGSEVSTSEKWATQADVDALSAVVKSAGLVLRNAKATEPQVTAATAKVNAAIAAFKPQNGTKPGSSPSGGGSSSVPSTGGGTTVTNPDGSKTNTKTNSSTGAVTETTTWPNGDKQVVVTKKDGTRTETVTKKDGTKTETVTKPDGSSSVAMTDAKGIKTETATSASGETTAKVTLPRNVDKTVVTIPVKDATEGTVAVIVDAKGNETVIKTAVATENGLELLVTGNVSVQIKDNAKKFVDIADDYWAKGAVDFVSSREIFKGVYETVFAPADLVNRGMMATVLYRLADAKAEGSNNFFDVPDGIWYTDAVTWANRSGVVTGYADGTFGPDDAVTREQMATMLFRYAKAMGMDISAKGDVSKFGDANDVSSWASEAMTWAVGVGLINGVADPATGTTLSPTKTATRAEVATIMQRMVKLMMQ